MAILVSVSIFLEAWAAAVVFAIIALYCSVNIIKMIKDIDRNQ